MSDGMGRELAYLSSHATNRYFIPNWGIYTQLSQMGKLKNLKKLEKLKPYALLLNIQPKRLLAITSNDRRE